ncbi:MurR/RpiR family transcriptional regulator [Mesorhizobium neociceri]|uniref:MurR/RpiR family transcriptional regulator n=1 Tax=Mesorhizobium neociceri TaxID=1307853 RepID=A0A838B806_9HYPH|nr:MurR/RpiR family transcriptional regulator [Mesorhizobium neociceri]MBA1142303.1 MurR/RpiR family transcriptional regulator [Mesorhizobium neociceri]
MLLDVIYNAINTAPNALARIALYIAQDPEAVLAQSIADLAHNTATGSASIVRFCRTLGLSGFREFKIALSGEIERLKLSGELAERASSEAMDTAPRVARLSTALQNSISASARGFDDLQINAFANRIRAARRVELFGTGPSSVCADILAMQLIRLGIPAHCSGSATVSHALSRGLGSSSLAIGISLRGYTVETTDFLAVARESGAYTIAITTRVDCPIAQAADEVVLFTSAGAWPQAGSAMHVPALVLLSEYLCQCLQVAEV